MEVADIAVKPVKEFAKDSYRLVRKCTKPDRKEFSKIATRTGLGFIVMGFVGFFVKLILYVCHARFLMISSRVHPRRLRGSVAFDPSNDPASRKIFLPRPLAIEAAPWGTRRGASSERSDRVCRDHAYGITDVANERSTRANASCPSLADRNAQEGGRSTGTRDLRHPQGTSSSNRLRSFFCFYGFRSLCHRLTLLLPSFPQHPHQQHHPRRVRERALGG